jgi:hypothetical protein
MSKNEKSNKVLKKPSQLTQHYHNALNPKKYSNKCVTINFRWKKVGENCVSIMFPIWKRFFPKNIHRLLVFKSDTIYGLASFQMHIIRVTMINLFPFGNKMETNFSPD